MNKKNQPSLGGLIKIGICGIVALSLAGCAGAAPDAGGSEVSASERISIKLLLSPVYYEPAYIAESEGFFAEQNLDVEFVEGGNAADQIPQLLSGQVDIALTGGVPLINAIEQGLPVKAIMGQQSADPKIFTSGILVKADSPIKSYADLENKTVGLQALRETTNLATLMAIRDAGADPSTVTFVQLPLPTINESITKGTVDAGYPIGIFYGGGIGAGLISIGSPTSDALPHGPNVLFAASDDYIAKNAEAIKRFNIALTKATELTAGNDQYIRDVQLEHSTLPADYIKAATIAPYSTNISRTGMQNTLDGMFEFGFIKTKLTFDDIVSPLAPTVN